uniref:Myo-inositol-1(Or 4)-monophosphatase n=1 Tax=Candidatus Kentrum sp. TC TaxID=2126339 RepID=A0A450YL94_9GAMM|nr:MAG: myo-inositol-1(or 4)-monophosphatase [Candidatus Kentron sp. TC]VFK42321.1 MAG: myo-inositol-1(or 4)-monophosphatase [Candidatus Kentron sp. TC]VFK59136.1 MAG: myo-inositol-1(or 4)-monophosphatase [Candidatus Kentron sp. TC]
MQLDPTKIHELLRIAAHEELLPRLTRVKWSIKADGSLLTEADIAMNTRLRRELTHYRPDIGFLSEEAHLYEQRDLLRTAPPLFWCMDPLDGSNNFAAGLPFFAVSLALIENGRSILGIVYDPIRDESFIAVKGRGATCNGKPLILKPANIPLQYAIALVNLKHLDTRLALRLVQSPPYGSQRNYGACALEWAWLAAGRGHIALHGGQRMWDIAAGSLIFTEAGGVCTTLDGNEFLHMTLDPCSVIAARDHELFTEWRGWLG